MITWFPQQQRSACVTACVRMVLTGFGQSKTEEQVRRALNQSAAGITLAKAHRQLLRQSVAAELHGDWNIVDMRDCLREGWHPIVGIERRVLGHPDASHAVVLVGISSQSVEAFDPLGTSTPEVFKLKTFDLAWSSAGQQALIIKSPFP